MSKSAGGQTDLPDLQVLWETSQREVALEGSNGCTLERLWQLVELSGAKNTLTSSTDNMAPAGTPSTPTATAAAQPDADDARLYLKGWLWR